MSLIKLENISKYYKSGEGVSVGMQKISLEFNIGEFVAVTGESGSGKSTLLNVISGLDSYEDGELYIQDEETSHFLVKDWENYRSKFVGFVFQNYNIIDSFTVYENVLLALEVQNYPRKERKKRALELIDKVGLTSHKHHKASKLSGGQKQRAVIARALAKDTPIIVADEPTGNLDSESSKQVISLLQELSKDKLIIIVTHDYDQVKEIATRHIKMHDGEVVEDKTLKQNTHEDVKIEPSIKPMTVASVARFALRNLLSKPRLLLFFIALQVMIILVFTMTYSNVMNTARQNIFNLNFDMGQEVDLFDFNTSNMSDNRMNVVRKDGQAMSLADIDYLSGLNNSNHFVYEGVLFIDNMGKNWMYYTHPQGYTENIPQTYKYDTTYFISKQPQFLIEGKMTNLSSNEVVVSNALRVDLGATIYSRIDAYVSEEVVPIQEDTYLYRFPFENYQDKNITNITWVITYNNTESIAFFGWDQLDLEARDYTRKDEVTSVSVSVEMYEIQEVNYTVVGIFNDSNRGALYFSHDELLNASGNQTLSLSASSEITAERLFKAIDKTTYRVIYPALEQNAIQALFAPINFLISLFFYTLIYGFALFLYFILYSVMKNVMSSRKKDFAIFRSIGTNESKLGLLVIFEQVYMMVISFIVSMIVINILSYSNYSMNLILQRLLPFDYVILFLTFTYLSIWLARRFNKKTFKISVIENLTESREDTL